MPRHRRKPALAFARLLASVAVTATLLVVAPGTSEAATLPSGFSESQLAGGLSNPTAMDIAPDGRVFVAEEGGRLRVIKDGALLTTPFLTVTTDTAGERGLLGVTFDPDFASNGHVYVYYTATSPTVHNRISRFTANGDVAVAGSETIIFELDDLSSVYHNGGAIHFGPDGKLYAATGENSNSANSQSLETALGKILRINADGSIPPDNPFYSQTSGRNRAIWALGLRNPFNFAFQPGTGRMFVNDVGASTWEEINEGIAGSNYGWPVTEGPTTDPRFRSPIYAYGHSEGCAITGGAFYNPRTAQLPADFVGDYFFSDYCSGWIRRLDPAAETVQEFATGADEPLDQKVASDGSLYYLERGTGSTTGTVTSIRYTASSAPTITSHPVSQTVAAGQPATFSVVASGDSPLSYQWQRNGVDIPGATSSTYTIPATQVSDSSSLFRARVANGTGSATSNEATLTVIDNGPPTATITQPAAGATYRAGDTISYSGTGTDAEDGELPARAFTWEVAFHHGDHTHPFIDATSGATTGSFTVPNRGETATDVWYRIHLTVTDPAGLSHHVYRDVLPQTSTLRLETNPPGLRVRLDGQPQMAPGSFTSVVGMIRTIAAPSPQSSGGTTWTFSSWSDGGAATHELVTPSGGTTYTATFTVGKTMAFGAVADARVEEQNPATNYGTAGGLRAQGDTEPDVGSYLKFTVSGARSIESAKLRMYVPNGTVDGAPLYSTSSTWSETGITWNNRPARSGGIVDDKATVPVNTWVEYDVTPLVTADGTYSFVLAGVSSDAMTMYSRNHTDPTLRPQLVLTTTAGGPGPSPASSFAPDADARVEEANPSTNYGTAWGLKVEGGSDKDAESYLRFSVTGTAGVQAAKLRLYVTNGSTDGPAVYATSNTWTETGLTWNNRPGRTSGVLHDKGTVAAGVWVEFDVTALVRGDGTYSFVLASWSSDTVTMHSRNHGDPSLRPQLVVTPPT